MGNVPTTDGTFATIGAGSIQIINKSGVVVDTLTATGNMLDGPWASAVVDHGSTAQLFISNVLSGTVGPDQLEDRQSSWNADDRRRQHDRDWVGLPGPAQFGSGRGGARAAWPTTRRTATCTSRPPATTRSSRSRTRPRQTPISGRVRSCIPTRTHLFGPIGLAVAPDGDLLATNDDAVNTTTEAASQTSVLTEFTTTGTFVGQLSLSPAAGAAFGFVILTHGKTVTIASVNDATNTVDFRSTTI